MPTPPHTTSYSSPNDATPAPWPIPVLSQPTPSHNPPPADAISQTSGPSKFFSANASPQTSPNPQSSNAQFPRAQSRPDYRQRAQPPPPSHPPYARAAASAHSLPPAHQTHCCSSSLA